VTFLRVARDQRGYETTFLLHSPRPGDRPRVLYWYRSAPGVRVGRRALDEEAIRTIEEQHPEIEFDWAHLLEEAESLPPEVERRPERPRRKPQRPAEPSEAVPPVTAQPTNTVDAAPTAANGSDEELRPIDSRAESNVASAPAARVAPQTPSNPLLEQLVGREIATRLRARYAEVAVRLSTLAEGTDRDAWQQRADALDPDRWTTPEAILDGIQHADARFDQLKRELPSSE
jgi:hypothetical protein